MKLFTSFLKSETKKQQLRKRTSANLRQSAATKVLHGLSEGKEFVFGEPWQLASESLVGEFTIIGSEAIHLLLKRMANA